MADELIPWPQQTKDIMLEHIFGRKVNPEIAQGLGLYNSVSNLLTKNILNQGYSDEQRASMGLYTRQGDVPYDLVYDKGKYSAQRPGTSPHKEGTTNVPSSPCGPGFELDYDENGNEVCVPVGNRQRSTLSQGGDSRPVMASRGASSEYRNRMEESYAPIRYSNRPLETFSTETTRLRTPRGRKSVSEIERDMEEVTPMEKKGISPVPVELEEGDVVGTKEKEKPKEEKKKTKYYKHKKPSKFSLKSIFGGGSKDCEPGEECPKF